MEWIEKITSLFDTVLRIVKYAKINNTNERDIASGTLVNTFAVRAQQKQQALRRTCITKSAFIKRNSPLQQSILDLTPTTLRKVCS